MQTPLKYRAKRASNPRPSYVLSFLLGVTLMLAFSKLGATNEQPPSHVYELRLYHAREGKVDLLKARFRDHTRSEEHTSELQSRSDLVCRLLLEKKNKQRTIIIC